jgi:hypothetical protein
MITKPPFGTQINHGHPQGNPAGLWTFSEGAGSGLGDSGSNNNLGNIDGATWEGSPEGGALRFNGIDNKVIIPESDTLDLSDDFTLIARIKYTADLSNIFNCGTSQFHWYFGIVTNKMRFTERSVDDYLANTTLSTDIWYRVGLTKRGIEANNLQFYLNGINDGSSSVGTIASQLGEKQIGVNNNLGVYSLHFEGNIDYVYLDNKALSPTEMKQMDQDLYQMFPRPDISRLFVPTPGFIPYIHSGGMDGGIGNLTGGMGIR